MLTLDHKRKFLNLAGQLSPENLTCDGELSRSQVNAKLKKLKAEWAKLEKQVGRSVSEDETWNWCNEVQEADDLDRRATMLLQPQHELMTHGNPGVWLREGANGSSAYYVHNAKYKGAFMFNGMDLNAGAEDVFILFSEFAYTIDRKEEIGRYDSLDAAVAAGESYLKGITLETLRAALPAYRPENLERLLKRLPAA